MGFLPGWDSADSTAAIAHNLHITAIVVLGLLVVSEALALIYDSRKEHLISAAFLNAEAARKNDVDAAEKRRAAEVQSLESKLAVAEKAATKAAEQAAELDRLRQPRHMLPKQRIILRDLLTGAPKLQLVIKAGASSGDERVYAEEIASVLRELAWDIRIDDALFMGSNVSGLWLAMKGTVGEQAPGAVITLHNALGGAGLDIRQGVDGDQAVPPNEIWLNVGRKK
jgi:hypothetical protein